MQRCAVPLKLEKKKKSYFPDSVMLVIIVIVQMFILFLYVHTFLKEVPQVM